MARTANYAWLVYGSGGPEHPACQVDAYYTDPEHSPTKWQETLTDPEEKADAIAIIEKDRAEAEAIPNGQGYYQSTVNASLRWYYRTSKKTGNSWEVVLDSQGRALPNACVIPPVDPRNSTVAFVQGVLKTEYNGDQVTLTLTGRLTEP